MIEIAIRGRGGRGGVTLAKLIAGAYFLKGRHVQAFGVYGAERTGAPVQAFARVAEHPIALHSAISSPNHVIVLDSSLIAPEVLHSADPDGWLILNATGAPETFAAMFPGRKVATVDANEIAVANRLGTQAVPIVNTALLGAVAGVLGLSREDAEAALANAGFSGGNVAAAGMAFEQVRTARLPGVWTPLPAVAVAPPVGLLDDEVGAPPQTRTGSWASRQPHSLELVPLCSHECPAGNDVRGFVQAAARGDHEQALAIILATSPFPGTCGRVCPAPCMASCNRRELDEPVNVREIERAVEEGVPRPPASRPGRKQRVAVVGSGPAGLSAAYHLARLGHPVRLFEAADELGGVLRTGIPAYRLPRAVLDREIAFIMAHGVTAETGRRVDVRGLAQLRSEFSAVLVATGLQAVRSLDVEATASCAVQQGISFLEAARRGATRLDDRRVVVIGGGNTAADAARTALRLGASEVRLAYRRTRAEMPAIPEEIDEALEEGVELCELLTPVSVEDGDAGPVLACRRMTMGEPDAAGRREPLPAAGGACVTLPCDVLVLAIGQDGDLSLAPDAGRLGERLSAENGDEAPVLLCGDIAAGDGTVAAAIGDGRSAARRIHAVLLAGETAGDVSAPSARREPADDGPLAGPDVLDFRAFPRAPQYRAAVLPAAERRRSFAEVRGGLRDLRGLDATVEEAARCLSCGACSECHLCLDHCPEGVVSVGGDRRFSADNDYCKGCGLCVSVCPRGAVQMLELGATEEVFA